MLSQSQKRYSQRTHPPVKRQAGRQQQRVSSAAATLQSFSLPAREGAEAILQKNWRAGLTFPEAVMHGELPNIPTLTHDCSQLLLQEEQEAKPIGLAFETSLNGRESPPFPAARHLPVTSCESNQAKMDTSIGKQLKTALITL